MDEPRPAEAPDRCAACAESLKPEAVFCPYCGLRRGDAPAPPATSPSETRRRTEEGLRDIRFVILVYAALLAAQGAAALLRAGTGNDFAAVAVCTAVIAVVTLIAAAFRSDGLASLFRRVGLGPLGLLLILLASYPLYWGVSAFVDGLTALFHLRPVRLLDCFEGRHPAWAIGIVIVAPALVEELCFRGVMFGVLRRRLSTTETLLITSIAFAAIHLSIPSLATHVPLGLYLGWLRHRSGSLYPPIFAHALHNAWVLAAEWAAGV